MPVIHYSIINSVVIALVQKWFVTYFCLEFTFGELKETTFKIKVSSLSGSVGITWIWFGYSLLDWYHLIINTFLSLIRKPMSLFWYRPQYSYYLYRLSLRWPKIICLLLFYLAITPLLISLTKVRASLVSITISFHSTLLCWERKSSVSKINGKFHKIGSDNHVKEGRKIPEEQPNS